MIKLDQSTLNLLLPEGKIESNQVVQLIQSRIKEYQPFINQSLRYYGGGGNINNSLTMMTGFSITSTS